MPTRQAATRRAVQTDGVTAADYLGPFFALMVLGVLLLVSRWVFAPNYRKHRKDYGLLVPVVTITLKTEAEAARNRLQAAGLRATIGPIHQKAYVKDGYATVTPPGHAVLVFPDDVDRARVLLATVR